LTGLRRFERRASFSLHSKACAAPQNCKRRIGASRNFLQFHRPMAGTPFAFSSIVILRYSCRAFVIAAACVASAARLHARGDVSPLVATQELNRCLSVVRAAARRSGAVPSTARARRADTRDC
jgi:hypothetical protein